MKTTTLDTDILILGGGAAGCYAALTLREKAPDANVLILEKADIRRSGCLAAGVNALNAYIVPGKTPDFYVDYAKKDAKLLAKNLIQMDINSFKKLPILSQKNILSEVIKEIIWDGENAEVHFWAEDVPEVKSA